MKQTTHATETERLPFKCYHPFNKPVEKLKTDWLPSLTVPDESMSLRLIISKYANGIPISNSKNPIYDDENESMGINPKTLDLVDIQLLKEQNALNQSRLQSLLASQEESAKAARVQAETDAIRKQVRDEIEAEKGAEQKH